MPTEDETRSIAHAEAIDATSSIHASCPPEEQIQAHAPREEREDGILPDSSSSTSGVVDDRHETSPPRTTDPDAQAGAQDPRRQGKNDEVEDSADFSSPLASPETPSDSDGKLARSMATAVLGGGSSPRASDDRPRYLSYPSLGGRQKLQPNSTTSFLHPGSKFRGTQQSDRQVYDVQVEIKDVDLAESFLCGYLRIQGLTDDHPTLTTFFTGEIVGPKHTFLTTHPSWNSTEKIDLQHWSRFPAFKPLARSVKSSTTNSSSSSSSPTSSSFTLTNYLSRDHLFMRWKEYFLVPDHRVKSISGASFEGFYYICFDQRSGGVSGIYFHAKSEKYQQLELKWVGDAGCVGAVEFR